MADRYLTKKQAADYIGVSVSTIDRRIANKAFPIIKLGGEQSSVRIDRVDLDRYMASLKEHLSDRSATEAELRELEQRAAELRLQLEQPDGGTS